MKTPTRVIALEEAFWIPSTREFYPAAVAETLDRISGGKLDDVGEKRIQRMDEAGIDFQVLSHANPGPQGFPPAQAKELARLSNEWLGQTVKAYPKRFSGFAALDTHDPVQAAKEFERTVKEYGFCGALINGHTDGQYLDQEKFWPLFERAQALDVPIYIHPANVPSPIMETYYKDYPQLAGAAWGWAVDTGTHLLRIICSGLLDKYPKVKIIVGHMGELIPFHVKRIERGIRLSSEKKLKKTFPEYLHDNIFITTSGVFDHASLSCSIAALGIDNILFSVDDPFEDNKNGVQFLKTASLSPTDREKLAHGNAERILKI